MNAFLRSVAMLSLVRTAADMLLPEGTVRGLCDTVLGLMIMLSMMTALYSLLAGWRG